MNLSRNYEHGSKYCKIFLFRNIFKKLLYIYEQSSTETHQIMNIHRLFIKLGSLTTRHYLRFFLKPLLPSLFHRLKLIFVQRIWSNMTDIHLFNLFLADYKFPGNSRDFPGKYFISRDAKNVRDPGFPGSRDPGRETLVGIRERICPSSI